VAIYFLDSSAVAKRYVDEPGSHWIRAILDPVANHQIHVSLLAGAEVVAAITRRKREGSLGESDSVAAIREFRDDFESLFRHITVNEVLIVRAMQLAERYSLRGYDAVQLASAAVLNERCVELGLNAIFVSADIALNNAAIAEGLQVENPNLTS
jgi:predicted nucleic acid-binding protein